VADNVSNFPALISDSITTRTNASKSVGGTHAGKPWKAHRKPRRSRASEKGSGSSTPSVKWPIGVGHHRNPQTGREYLKTEADGYEPNNLLSLPECP